MDNLVTLQYLAKSLGLRSFRLIPNTAVYEYLLEGKTATILDEYGRDLYVVAPYKGALKDYRISTDILLEEVAKIYPIKTGSQSFVNMLNTDLGSLDFSARYENYDAISEDVKRTLAGLLAMPIMKGGATIRVDDDLMENSLDLMPSNKAPSRKSAEKAEDAEADHGFMIASKISSAFLIVLIVVLCLSTVVNYKMTEDVALLQQVNSSMSDAISGMEGRKVYMNHSLAERRGDSLSFNYVYALAQHLQVDGLLADVRMTPTQYEITYLLKSQVGVDVIREKLGALIEIDEGEVETLTRDGVNLYKVSFIHKLK